MTRQECTRCKQLARDRAVYRCIYCNVLKCEHLIGTKHPDPERPGKYAGSCGACRHRQSRMIRGAS